MLVLFAPILYWLIKKANEIKFYRNQFFEWILYRKVGNHVWIAFLIARILSKNKLCRNIELKSFWIAVFAEKSMTCFCSAPDCGNWLKTISQMQISSMIVFRSQTVWSYLTEWICENLFALVKQSKFRFALELVAEFEPKMNQRSHSVALFAKE
jgi:hypothetical protein